MATLPEPPSTVGEQVDDTAPDPREQWLWRADALRLSALHYATCGIPVFPLWPACPAPAGAPFTYRCDQHGTSCGKTPQTKNGFKDATTDLEQVRTWWTRSPQANIGTPTGLLFDVIDVDGPAGIASMLERFPDLNDIGAPLLGRTTTPRGGGHHLLIAPTGQGNRAGLFPSVDYRGTGGYIVLPPSRGGNGRLYRWLTPIQQVTGNRPEGAA